MRDSQKALCDWAALAYSQRKQVIDSLMEASWNAAAKQSRAFAVAAAALQAAGASQAGALDLNQVTLPATDIPRAITFYTGMGFTLIVDSPAYARFLCPAGNATFSVHAVDSVPAASGAIVYFESASLDALVMDLKERGYRFTQEPTDQPWLWREARLEDPDGNVICLYFAGVNRIDPPWRVRSLPSLPSLP